MVATSQDSPLKRKRGRLERTDSDGVFAFFRRKFFRNASPTTYDENNNDVEHEHESDPTECSSDDYDMRGLRRVTATGVDQHSNDVLLRVARTAMATANVVFFPGDVQDFHSSMISGSYAEYDSFSYEHTAELLAAKFGENANVWIVRPSRFQFGTFACFDGFVDTNKVGAATSYPSNGSAVEQLVSLMENVREILEHDAGQEQVSTLLPVHLVGFSKGGIVLNQIATEVATRWREDTFDNNHHLDASDASETIAPSPTHASLCRQFASMVTSIHWLDSGNGSAPGAVPVEQQTLVGLSSLHALQLCVHVTPYQFESKERPWIQKEVLHFLTALQRLGGNASLLKYFEHDPATLASHFQILHEFQLPSVPGICKTSLSHSPEVALTPVAIQPHA